MNYHIKVLFLFALLLSYWCSAQDISSENITQIEHQIEQLKIAHLNSDSAMADALYHPKMILTSQSGKKYNKEIALKNIENNFEIYESSEIEFLPISNDVVLTNYVNERKYKTLEKGRYRLTVVWTKHEKQWKIISMQSSKIKKKK